MPSEPWHHGYCNVTDAEDRTCGDEGHSTKSSWLLLPEEVSSWSAARAACATLCATLCSRASCRFISYSLKHRDCSRFAACDIDRLQTSVDGFRTYEVSDGERSERRLRAVGEQDLHWLEKLQFADVNTSSTCCHLVLFRHLPKTGGSSLRKWLLDALPRRSWSRHFPWWHLGADEDVLDRRIRRDRAVDRWLCTIASGGLPQFNLAVEYHARTDGAGYFLDVLRRARGLEGRLEQRLIQSNAPRPRLPRIHTLLLLREPHVAVESFRRYTTYMRGGDGGATLDGFCRAHARFQSAQLLMRAPMAEAARTITHGPNCSSSLACQLHDLLTTASERTHPWRGELQLLWKGRSAGGLDHGALGSSFALDARQALRALLGPGGVVGSLAGLGTPHGLIARLCDAIHLGEPSAAAARCRLLPVPHLLHNFHVATPGAARCPPGTLDAEEVALYREALRRDKIAQAL